MKVNTHGLKMIGLRKAAGATKPTKGYYDGYYIQISYNIKTGEIHVNEHWNLGHNDYVKYHNPDIINVGNICTPTTMQGIADMIHYSRLYWPDI